MHVNPNIKKNSEIYFNNISILYKSLIPVGADIFLYLHESRKRIWHKIIR